MKTKDLEKLSQEEFDEVIPATGPALEGQGNTPIGPGVDPELLAKSTPPIKNPSKEAAEMLKEARKKEE